MRQSRPHGEPALLLPDWNGERLHRGGHADCTNIAGTVQEGKTCNAITLTCDPVPGPNKAITWWETCPESDTCTAPLATIDDLTTCVDTSADTIVNELRCLQFRGNGGGDWPCPIDVP